MNAGPWAEAKALFERLTELPQEERHPALSSEAVAPEVRQLVERLLAGDRLAGEVQSRPTHSADARPSALGVYRIEDEIGRGGMGVVYEGFRDDGQFRKRVALKLLKRGVDTDEALERFQAERTILGRLEHPNIAQILDAGSSPEGLPFFAMEYVAGVPIDAYCRREALAVAARIELFTQVCEAVHHAHQHLVAHRDLKPTNILVSDDGIPKLLDFGIAKIVDPTTRDLETTQRSQRVLTPQFASPEQLRGEPITTASDVYSLGVILYLLLTDAPPYSLDGLSVDEIAQVLDEEATRPSLQGSPTNEPIDRDLDAIVRCAMRVQPAERYASARQLASDIQRYRENLPIVAREPTLRYRVTKLLRRHKLAAALAVGVTTAAAVTSVLSLQLARSLGETRTALEQADLEANKAKAATNFLVDLIRDADPRGPLGREMPLAEVLALGADRARSDLSSEPLVQAALLDAIGRVYLDLGDTAEATPLLETALDLRRQHLGEKHLDFATSLNHMGMLRRDQRNPEAEELIRRALRLRKGALPADSPEIADSLTNLGGMLLEMRRMGEASEALREALALRRRIFPSPHRRIAESEANLASVLLREGNAKEAVALYEQAIDTYERALGERHPDLAVSLQNLALARYDVGEAEQGRIDMERALELLHERLGDNHPDLLVSMSNAARKALDHGDAATARGLAEELLARRALPTDLRGAASDRRLLGRIFEQDGDLEAAAEQLRLAVAHCRDAQPPDGRGGASGLVALATVTLAAGHRDEADGAIREALELRRTLYPPEDRRIALAESVYASVDTAFGRWDDAKRRFETNLQTIRAHYPEEHRLRRRAEARLADYCASRPSTDPDDLCS